jgi:hypothetical protein
MHRVHGTLAELDTAVGDVERGLELLDNGLGSVEQDVDNGRLQLYSTGKVSNDRQSGHVTNHHWPRRYVGLMTNAVVDQSNNCVSRQEAAFGRRVGTD